LLVLLSVAGTARSRAENLVSNQRPATTGAPLTALDRYVQSPDSTYAWKLAGSTRAEGGTAYFIDMTSQSWLTTNEVDRPLWRHWLVVVRPDDLREETALVFIGGGNNKDPRQPKANPEIIRIARETRSVVAELRTVPNQPLIFDGDGVERSEDDLIAYTWDKFLKTGDERWPARLPMTKAVVRALDTITAFCGSEQGGRSSIQSFVVAGGSKRGWTTWTTAIVDKRVVAICPIVIDVLNLEASMKHHYQAYGFWAPAVGDYVHHGIMDWMKTPQMAALMRIEDPYSYRDRLDLPKLLINACGDQFFLPDSSRFYLDQLKGPTYVRYVPNADHSLKNSDAYDSLLAWHHATLHHTPLPRFHWTHPDEGSVIVRTQDRPLEARLWQATNADARDFRLETLGPVWKETTLTATDDAEYRVSIPAPDKGWTAYMVELVYDIGAPTKLKVTTDVRVIPDRLPFGEPPSPHAAAR
jgi:PhoPQ-activated pathogenicity-related protein